MCLRFSEGVLFNVVKLVRNKIKAEKSQTRGAILYEGLSSNSTYHVGIFASYIHRHNGRVNSQDVGVSINRVMLIAFAPMAQVKESSSDDEHGDNEKTTKFNAETHIKFFDEIL